MVGLLIMKDLSSTSNERQQHVLQIEVRNRVVCSTGSRGFSPMTWDSTAGASAAPDRRVVLLAVSPLAGNDVLAGRDQALWTRHCAADGPFLDGRTQ